MAGMVIKFDFNCIIIDKDGIHRLDINAADPLAELAAAPEAAQLEVPKPSQPSSAVAAS